MPERNGSRSGEESARTESEKPQTDIWQAMEDWRTQASFDWPDGRRDRCPSREFSWPE